MKTRKILTTLALITVVLIAGCKKDNFVEKVGVCPTVVSTNPANAATDVPLNQVITVTFNEKMNPATITQSSFTLQGASKIPGTLAYDGTGVTMTFTPTTQLSLNTTYTGRVTTAVKDLSGSALQKDFVWTFSTGAILSPIVISTDPPNNGTGVFLNKIVYATFNMPMDPLTLTPATFTLKQGTTSITGTVAYNGTVASLTPSSALAPNTVYTGTITTGVRNTAGTSMENNYTWSFTTGSITAPRVIATDPANNATDVVLNKIITASFSEPMNPSTITATTFTLKQGETAVAGTVSYTGTTAFFLPSAMLLPNTVYTGIITTGAKNVAGTPLANDYVWTFTTGSVTAPRVISTDPANNATGVVLNKIVLATFSMPMDPLTITTTTFTLRQGVNAIAGTVSYSGTTAFFKPAGVLITNTVYTGTITTGARNVAGIPLANDYVWTFSTGTVKAPAVIGTDPANNAVGVALNKIISASFSDPMDPLTVTTATFTISQGAAPVTGTVSYTGTTAFFLPSAALLPNTIYTGTITTGAKNVAGTPLANDYIWTFTTLSNLTVPTVISTDPVNSATGVALGKTITATFSEPMDPLTITPATFTLNQGSTPVTGSVSYSGTTASFQPSGDLLPGTTYTATITTGAMNVPGTPLANDYVWNFSTGSTTGPPPVVLGTAARFGIFAGVGVSNNAGFSEIHNLDVGISPGLRSSVTGFPPAIIVNGAIFAADDPVPVPAMLIQAKLDLTAAYLFAEAATTPAPVTVSGDQGGKTLAPGIYKSTSTLLIQSGDLTLDAQGDVNAVWIFQVASGFTTIGGAGGSVILSGGAQAANVFWQTGSSATIGDYTSFQGNILALTSITMNSHATAVGRMLAINGAVVMTHTNMIDKP